MTGRQEWALQSDQRGSEGIMSPPARRRDVGGRADYSSGDFDRQLRWIPPTAGVQMIGIDHRLTPSSPHVGLCNRLPIIRADTRGGEVSMTGELY